MTQQEQGSVDEAVERLFSDHLFDPTNKPQWISKLVEEGLKEEDAKRAYKVAANRYHSSRNELNNKKSSIWSKLGKAVGYTGAGIFTWIIMPWVYVIGVLLFVALLGFIFNF